MKGVERVPLDLNRETEGIGVPLGQRKEARVHRPDPKMKEVERVPLDLNRETRVVGVHLGDHRHQRMKKGEGVPARRKRTIERVRVAEVVLVRVASTRVHHHHQKRKRKQRTT